VPTFGCRGRSGQPARPALPGSIPLPVGTDATGLRNRVLGRAAFGVVAPLACWRAQRTTLHETRLLVTCRQAGRLSVLLRARTDDARRRDWSSISWNQSAATTPSSFTIATSEGQLWKKRNGGAQVRRREREYASASDWRKSFVGWPYTWTGASEP